jgi:carboxylesterase type B
MMALDVQVLKNLQSSLPDSLLQRFGLSASQTTEVSSMKDIIQKLIMLNTDALFAANINYFSREFNKTGAKIYSYHFDRGNPFPGPLNGIAHHALDLEYTFGNFLEGFPEKEDVNLSKALMRLWIKFAHGEAPWEDYASGKALYITPDAEVTVVPREQVTTRRWNAYDEMEKSWAQVRKAGNMLINRDLEW